MNAFVKPDTVGPLSRLKDFQKKTVDYVCSRFYEDNVRRFLVADEVGLGKTFVARGIVARTIDHLWDRLADIKRIDIVYICSNADIARQNINRLNVFDTNNEDKYKNFATRLTLLPLQIGDLDDNPINFISFTPGTSFNLRSSGGIAQERVLLYYLLRKAWKFEHSYVPMNIFQYGIKDHRCWRERLQFFCENAEKDGSGINVDKKLHQAFLEDLKKQPEVKKMYRRLAKVFLRSNSRASCEDRALQRKLIGTLRRILAKACVDRLEPDLIILDEFQRFRDLFDSSEENEAAQLAQSLINYRDEHTDPRVLLLSATPYKPITLYDESETDDHYEEFISTVAFLLDDKTQLVEFKKELRRFREALLAITQDQGKALQVAKHAIEKRLKLVIARTERESIGADKNAMLEEASAKLGELGSSDLEGFVVVDRVAQAINAGDAIEYWKSAPYILNTMDRTGYKIKRDLDQARKKSPSEQLIKAIIEGGKGLLNWQTIEAYHKLDPANARIRCVMEESVDKGAWELLWVPPSLTYYQAKEGPFAVDCIEDFSKTLVFSSWQIVPKVISILCSYEAERRMIEREALREKKTWSSYSNDYSKKGRLLDFLTKDDEATRMNTMVLLYPCLTLAELVDPGQLAVDFADDKGPPSQKAIEDHLSQLIGKELEPIVARYKTEGRKDASWYWASLVLLDKHHYNERVASWLNIDEEGLAWKYMVKTRNERDGGFAKYVQEIKKMLGETPALGAPPDDLRDVLVKVALGSPAVTALRSLMRAKTSNSIDDSDYSEALMANAAWIALGFRTLFNLPTTISMVRTQTRKEESRYWEHVLDYCAAGNLQAVLDEYVHVLLESQGLMDKTPEDIFDELAKSIRDAVSLRTVSLGIDEIRASEKKRQINFHDHTMRCRFAMRFGDGRSEESGEISEETRKEQVRDSFNSPFWPFVLSTTSIGQEGLDFHHYCHNIIHWNLPNNPADFEQREGRIHRHKGHAIRKNVADKFPLISLKESMNAYKDPWELLFELAYNSAREKGATTDLVPFWVFPDGRYKINRRMPVYPLSRDIERLERLKKSLVSYRLVFGQPRQEDLLEYVQTLMGDKIDTETLSRYLIDLSPC